MTQPTLDFNADTFTGRVAHLFRSRPDTWIDGLEIAQIAGHYAWRSRISDARREFGLKIVNRQRKVGRVTISEYRLEVNGEKV